MGLDMTNITLEKDELQDTKEEKPEIPTLSDNSESQVQQPNALAILNTPKSGFPAHVRTYLKKNFEAHWLDDQNLFTTSFYSIPINYELFAKSYLTKEKLMFCLEPICDPYFEKDDIGKKIECLEQVKSFKFREFMNQMDFFWALLKDFNKLFKLNIKKPDLEENSDAIKAIHEGGNQRVIDHLEIVMDCLNKASKKSADISKMSEKIQQVSKDDLILSPKSPLQSAKKFIQDQFIYKGNRTIHFCGDAFWKWKGPCYEEVHPNEMRKFMYTFLDGAKTNQEKGLVNFDPNQSKVNNVLDAFKAIDHCNHVPESGPAWLSDQDSSSARDMLVFRNGMQDIRSWLNNPEAPLIPHTPLFLNPNYLPFDFNPNAEEPKEWLKFLHSLWKDDQQSIDTLQDVFGYILSNDNRMHKIFMIIGPPRSGKGTIARILRSVVGEKNSVGPTLSSLSETFGLQPWLGKQLSTISDARLDIKSNHSVIAERLLNISGEDPITINRKYRISITTTLPTRILVISNELPDIKDSSGALANRFIILSLTETWLGKEDLDLEIRIRRELPGILLWALRGLKRLRERKRFIHPGSSSQDFEEMMAMSSPIKAFINDRCELAPKKWIEVGTLFKSWKKWCDDVGNDRPGSLQLFGRNLRAAAPKIKITRPRTEINGSRTRIRKYEGIGLSILPND